ncbi:MAG: MATE family efflux transporter [Lachnospiraceae bacterium]|nr:MATE family efflux transporter [Robinsoniella sp.]MDY3767903.1 MATE family efflux transporter [Lachnospiraceae bacterium]
MESATNKLGTAKIGPLLLQLALPAITAQLINMLYNIVDRIYIGHMAENGNLALTGVGVCFPVIILIMAFSSLVGMGGAPQAAIYLGKKEEKNAQKVLGNCFVVLIGLAVILTAVFLIFGRNMLMIFGASDNTIEYAVAYMNIYVSGTIFVMISLGLNAFITTQGYAKTSMMTVVIGALVNIVLDPIFIFGFQLGVKGAAYATVLSQGISAVWVLRFLTGKKTTLRIRKADFKLEKKIILPVLALGLSPFVMQSTESLLSIAFNSSLQRYGGDLAVGAMTILNSVMQILSMPLHGLTQGAQPIISYNYGAGNRERVEKAFKLLFCCAVSFSTAFWLFNMIFPRAMVSLFGSTEALLEEASWALRIYFATSFVMGVQNSCQQTFVAVGQAKISLFLACLRKIILLIPLIYILPNFFEDKVFAVFLAEPVADFLAASTTFVMFCIVFRRLMNQIGERKNA